MDGTRFLGLFLIALSTLQGLSDEMISDGQPLKLPRPGAYQLRVLSPTILELTLITTKKPDPAPVDRWNFVTPDGKIQLRAPDAFAVSADAKPFPVKSVGFKRRVLYAPF